MCKLSTVSTGENGVQAGGKQRFNHEYQGVLFYSKVV